MPILFEINALFLFFLHFLVYRRLRFRCLFRASKRRILSQTKLSFELFLSLLFLGHLAVLVFENYLHFIVGMELEFLADGTLGPCEGWVLKNLISKVEIVECQLVHRLAHNE